MQFTNLATLLALTTASTLATPVPANNVNDSLQKQILAMEITILNITNSIVQSSPSLKVDYNAGIKQFIPLISGLEGPQRDHRRVLEDADRGRRRGQDQRQVDRHDHEQPGDEWQVQREGVQQDPAGERQHEP